jgi:hypothetical protein
MPIGVVFSILKPIAHDTGSFETRYLIVVRSFFISLDPRLARNNEGTHDSWEERKDIRRKRKQNAPGLKSP